jgi:hypothetical protein
MIRRVLLLLAVCGMCVGSIANAADLPTWKAKSVIKTVEKPAIQKPVLKTGRKTVKKSQTAKKVAGAAQQLQPVELPKVRSVVASRVVEPDVVEPDAVSHEFDMTWVPDTLVANSDGPKREGSAGQESNLVVAEPGHIIEPNMIIELSGHIIKTIGTTARIDIRVGTAHRTVSWTVDDVQAGRFNISLNETLAVGKLPEYFPVSALVFVTKDGKDGAALLSLDKVVVHVGKVSVAASQ